MPAADIPRTLAAAHVLKCLRLCHHGHPPRGEERWGILFLLRSSPVRDRAVHCSGHRSQIKTSLKRRTGSTEHQYTCNLAVAHLATSL